MSLIGKKMRRYIKTLESDLMLMFLLFIIKTGILMIGDTDRYRKKEGEWVQKTVGKTDELKYQDLDRRVWRGKKGECIAFKPVYCWILKLALRKFAQWK